MAAANSTPATPASAYEGRPLLELLNAALEMVAELREEQSRQYVLALAIGDRLYNNREEGGDPLDHAAWRLSQVLEERATDQAQFARLEACLSAALRPIEFPGVAT